MTPREEIRSFIRKYLSKCFLAFVVRHLCRFLGAGDINVTLRFTKSLLLEHLIAKNKDVMVIWQLISKLATY